MDMTYIHIDMTCIRMNESCIHMNINRSWHRIFLLYNKLWARVKGGGLGAVNRARLSLVGRRPQSRPRVT